MYQAKDGTRFSTLLKAREHDAKLELSKWLEQPLTPDKTLHDAITRDCHALAKILNDLVKYAK